MAAGGENAVRMMISYGGTIRRRSRDGLLTYADGEHRIIKVGRATRLPELRARLAALAGSADVCIRYILPGEGLGSLRPVTHDGHLQDLMFVCGHYRDAEAGHVRVFLFCIHGLPLPSERLLASIMMRRRSSSPARTEEDCCRSDAVEEVPASAALSAPMSLVPVAPRVYSTTYVGAVPMYPASLSVRCGTVVAH